MASVTTHWTFNELPAVEAQKVVLENAFNDTDFSVLQGYDNIIAKEQIPFLGLFGISGKASQGCSPTRESEDLTGSEKFWDPEKIGIYKVLCSADYDKEITAFMKQKGISGDMSGTVLADWFTERMGTLVKESTLRHIWFGDKTAANYNDSPAGVITNSVSPDYFNVIDGIWEQIFTLVAGDSTKRYTITKNSGNSYANQALAAAESKTIFEGMWAKADLRLRTAPNKRLIVTQSIADNYRAYLSSVGVNESFMRVENGTSVLRWNGIEIVEYPFFDRMINSYLNNGTVWYLPHRAILTTTDNLAFGTDSLSEFNSFETFYNAYTRENVMDADLKLDAKLIQDSLIEVAY